MEKGYTLKTLWSFVCSKGIFAACTGVVILPGNLKWIDYWMELDDNTIQKNVE